MNSLTVEPDHKKPFLLMAKRAGEQIKAGQVLTWLIPGGIDVHGFSHDGVTVGRFLWAWRPGSPAHMNFGVAACDYQKGEPILNHEISWI